MAEITMHTYTYFVDDVPRYVGVSGKDDRAVNHLGVITPVSKWQEYLKDAVLTGSTIRIKLAFYHSQHRKDAWDEALLAEGQLIAQYGRLIDGSGTLYNIHAGSSLSTLLVNRIGHWELRRWLRAQATDAELHEAVRVAASGTTGYLSRVKPKVTSMAEYDAFIATREAGFNRKVA